MFLRTLLLLSLFLIDVSAKRGKRAARSSEADEPRDNFEEAMKYKGILQCAMCEDLVEFATVKHFEEPLGQTSRSMDANKARRRRSEEMRTLQARNSEIMDKACSSLMKKAKEADDKGRQGMNELYCMPIREMMEDRLMDYMLSLHRTKAIRREPDEKGRISDPDTVDRLCEAHCDTKLAMKKTMEEVRQKMENMKKEMISNLTLTSIFRQAFRAMWDYRWLTLLGFIACFTLMAIITVNFFPPTPPKLKGSPAQRVEPLIVSSTSAREKKKLD